jgi:hypothetical protein
MSKPEELIKLIRESFIGSEHVYTHGSCYQLYMILKAFYSNAKPWVADRHIITEIGGNFYDINGPVNWISADAKPYNGQDDLENCKFSLWDCGLECPNCDEMVCYSTLVA